MDHMTESVYRVLVIGVQLYRYLVSQESVVPVKAMTDTLAKHFPQYKFAQGKGAEVKKVINNSKVQSTAASMQ